MIAGSEPVETGSAFAVSGGSCARGFERRAGIFFFAIAPCCNRHFARAENSGHRRVTYNTLPIFGTLCHFGKMIVIGTGLVESDFANHAGHRGIKAARSQYIKLGSAL
jgi:hypothetical protein